MRLFRKREETLAVSIDPGELAPGATASVTVHAAGAFENVRSARVELGYDNAFSYKWLGEIKAPKGVETADLLIAGHSTDGDTREGTEWVEVVRTDLLVGTDGVLGAGEHRVDVSIPEDAPPGSDGMIKWAARVVVETGSGDERAEARFRVLCAPPELDPDELELEREKGDSCDVDIKLARAAVPVGGAIEGRVLITARSEVPAAGATVFLYRDRESHPTHKTPGGRNLSWKSRSVIAKKQELVPGELVELPFTLEVPADLEPTASGVHSSVRWWVHVALDYGWTGPSSEQVRRAVVLYIEPSTKAA